MDAFVHVCPWLLWKKQKFDMYAPTNSFTAWGYLTPTSLNLVLACSCMIFFPWSLRWWVWWGSGAWSLVCIYVFVIPTSVISESTTLPGSLTFCFFLRLWPTPFPHNWYKNWVEWGGNLCSPRPLALLFQRACNSSSIISWRSKISDYFEFAYFH